MARAVAAEAPLGCGDFAAVKEPEGEAPSDDDAEAKKGGAEITPPEAVTKQIIVMIVFSHLARGRCSLYNRMRDVIGKRSKLFPETSHPVKDLRCLSKRRQARFSARI